MATCVAVPHAVAAIVVQQQAGAPAPLTRAERAAARRAAKAERAAERRPVAATRAAQRSGADTATYRGSDGTDIVVVGLRQSVEKSVDRKRRARQIVDVVTAEDAGKLPDNNVVEALSRVTGISITRAQGQGAGLTIRGLDGVQTTVNGNEIAGAGARSLSLSAIPAELIKSVEVYKTRTADQIEGGIAGTVNVELRRPLDLKKGWTVAGSFRESYNSLGPTWSPFASLLVANRFDTGIGEIGVLVNAGYAEVKYSESYNTNESPSRLLGVAAASLPEANRDTAVAPYRAQYGLNTGTSKQPSVSAALQWRASPQLDFVLEGSYFGYDNSDQYRTLNVLTREDYYTIQNPRFGASGVLLGYDIVNVPPATGAPVNFGLVRAGTNSGASTNKTDTYRGNFEAHWYAPGVRIDGAVQYQRSTTSSYSNGYEGTFQGVSRIGIDFDSRKVPGGGPAFDFYGVDITDPGRINIFSFFDNLYNAKTTQFSANIDVTKEISPSFLVRSVKFGARYSSNATNYGSSYRFAGWFDPERQPALTSVSGVGGSVVTPKFQGGTSTSWFVLDPVEVFNKWNDIRSFIIANNPEFLDGPGRDNGAASHFASARPSSEDPVFTGMVKENSFAAYGSADYAFKALFPIDGNVGLRYVNTFGSLTGRNLISGRVITDPVTGRPALDENGNQQFQPFTVETTSVRVNYVDLLPSAFGVVHFTPKLQLRGGYSHNVQRPDLGLLRAYRNIDYANVGAEVFSGNPNLQPIITDDFNASLEWYFGRGGIVSVGGFIKKQKGFIYETRQLTPVPELGGALRYVRQPRNAGPGETQGVEFQATGFFSFLPGFLGNFGATVNGTWIPKANLSLPLEADPENAPGVYQLVTYPAPFTSRLTYNLIGYYETPTFSARVAYNRRTSFRTGVDAVVPFWIQSSYPTSRLDAAINVTPVRFLTLSVEATNILRASDRYNYASYPELPVGLRQMGRTIQAGARFRF